MGDNIYPDFSNDKHDLPYVPALLLASDVAVINPQSGNGLGTGRGGYVVEEDGTWATPQLDNLSGVSINDHLIPQSNKDIGSTSLPWRTGYFQQVNIGTTPTDLLTGYKLQVRGSTILSTEGAGFVKIGNAYNNIHVTYDGSTGNTSFYTISSGGFYIDTAGVTSIDGTSSRFLRFINGAYLGGYQQAISLFRYNFNSTGPTIILDDDGYYQTNIGTPSVYKILSARYNSVEKAYITGTGSLWLNSIPNATADVDKFIVSDSGVLKYRTGAEIISDLSTELISANLFIQNQFASEQVASGNIVGRFRISTINVGNYYLDIGRAGTGVYNKFRVGTDSTLRVEQDQFAGITFDASGSFYGGLRFITIHGGVSTIKFDVYDGIRIGWISNIPTYFEYFWDINTVEKMRLSNAGNLMLGVSTDNGTRLQVKGSAITNGYFLDTGWGNSYIQIANSNGYDFKLGVEGSGIVAFKSAVGSSFTNFLYGHSSGNIAVGTTVPSVWSGTCVMYVPNGTAPSVNNPNFFAMYSQDIVAGNAAPHFRTEVGDIIKLYKNASVNTIQGLADTLVNLGVLTSSTIRKNDIDIPRPMLEYMEWTGGNTTGGSTNKLFTVHFLPGSHDWLQYEPRLFLFRYKRKRRTKRPGHNGAIYKQTRAWVHPSDTLMVSSGVWEGSHVFNGTHRKSNGDDIGVTRRTEWFLGVAATATATGNTYPEEFTPYHRKRIPLNLENYWFDSTNGFDSLTFPIAVSALEVVSPTTYTSGERKKGNSSWTTVSQRKNHYFRFAYAINNPNFGEGSDQNLLIFGPMSDILTVYLRKEGTDYTDLALRIGSTRSGVR